MRCVGGCSMRCAGECSMRCVGGCSMRCVGGCSMNQACDWNCSRRGSSEQESWNVTCLMQTMLK